MKDVWTNLESDEAFAASSHADRDDEREPERIRSHWRRYSRLVAAAQRMDALNQITKGKR